MLMHENNIKRTSDGILVKAMDISFGATIVIWIIKVSVNAVKYNQYTHHPNETFVLTISGL